MRSLPKKEKNSWILFHPASPFFHLFVQSSFNKACFCCAGNIPSIPPTRSWRITGKGKDNRVSPPTEPLKLCCINKSWCVFGAWGKWPYVLIEFKAKEEECWHCIWCLIRHCHCLCLYSTPRQLRLLGYPEEKKQNKTEKQTRGRESVCFHEWVSGGCITPSPATSRAGPCQLDLKWSCSEATARSCGSININAQGNATRAQKRNRFYLPSDPYTNLCKQNSLFIVLIQQSFSLCPGKKFMPLHNVS